MIDEAEVSKYNHFLRKRQGAVSFKAKFTLRLNKKKKGFADISKFRIKTTRFTTNSPGYFWQKPYGE